MCGELCFVDGYETIALVLLHELASRWSYYSKLASTATSNQFDRTRLARQLDKASESRVLTAVIQTTVG